MRDRLLSRQRAFTAQSGVGRGGHWTQWSSMWHTDGPGGGGRAGTTTSGDCTAPTANTRGLVWGLQPQVIEIGAVGRATGQRLRRRCKGCEQLSVIEWGGHGLDPSSGNSPASREVLPARQEGASWGRRACRPEAHPLWQRQRGLSPGHSLHGPELGAHPQQGPGWWLVSA